MKLKEKFSNLLPFYNKNDNHKKSTECEKIADDYAIDFYNWMRKNDTSENSNKFFHYTDKDMLNAFKEEKGL